MRLKFTRKTCIAALVGSLLLAGCDGLRYVTHLVEGQLAINTDLEDIKDVLASGRLNDDDAFKLDLVGSIREFTINEMGMIPGDSYTQFLDTRGAPLVFNLSASRRDRFEPVIWTFPIAGAFPSLGFFDEAYLEEIESDLIAAGNDTFIYEADAYSTLGLLADPVRSPMLRRDVVSLSDTIIHEILHQTIWRPNDITFNESLATFVGQQGAIEFLDSYFDPALQVGSIAATRFADQATINDFLVSLYEELAAFYNSGLSSAEIIAQREAMYEAGRQRFADEIQPTLFEPAFYDFYRELPTNNAWMLLNRRYNFDLSLFARVYNANGQQWRPTLIVFREAANAAGDPFEYLRNWLATNVADESAS